MRATLCCLALLALPTAAQQQLEALDRGVVAVRSSSTQAFIGWRSLGDDPAGAGFNLYRSANGGAPVKLNPSPLTGATHFTDTPDFAASLTYSVRRVAGGTELPADGSFTLPAAAPVRSYLEVPLQRPPGGTSPDDTTYTYNANDAAVGDLDGDGQLEIVLRWEPSNTWGGGTGGHTGPVLLDAYEMDGTRLWRIDLGRNINASAHITVFLVYDFDGDGRAELACMTSDGSVDGTGQILGNAAADHRNGSGVVLVGPEYLTIFDGQTGGALASTLFVPQRHPDTLYPTPAQIDAVWGDDYGNRVNRFLAGVAYLDGKRPSIIFSRGYYTRSVIAAWDWRGGQLSGRWVFDSDDGTPGNAAYRGQGNHDLSIADVDGDGFDEIIYGSCTIDHDGQGLYTTGLHHGDALHVSDMDPDRPGLEVFAPHESPETNGGIGTSFRDARTGEVIWSTPAGSDVGRGVAFDIDPAHPGFEAWASNSSSHYNSRGGLVANSRPATFNFGIWWDGDAGRELLDGTRIDRWNPATLTLNRLLTGSGVSSNNGTKATPCLSGDILGDWREEVVWRTSDDSALRIYTSSIPTDLRLTTLLHDPQYRVALAWQNAGYNQPPHPSYFLGHGMTSPPRAPVWRQGLVWRGSSGSWSAPGAWLDPQESPATFANGERVLFDLTGAATPMVSITDLPQPAEMVVHAPETVDYTLDGGISGPAPLIKAGGGRLVLAGTHAHSGPTRVQQGSLFVNGMLSLSQATIEGRARAGGSGSYGAGLTLRPHARLSPGPGPQAAGTLAVGGALEMTDVTVEFDLGTSSDLIAVLGPLVAAGTNTIALRLPDGPLAPGSYPLIQFTGGLTGGLENFQLTGLSGMSASLALANGLLSLVVEPTRPAAAIHWRGSGSQWDLNLSENWLLAGSPARFVTGDAVTLDDAGAAVSSIMLADELFPASLTVTGAASYSISGSGFIAGGGGLAKSGGGTLSVATANTFTGPVTISGGTVETATLSLAGSPGPLGAGTGAIVLAGGTLRTTGGFASTDRPFTLSAPSAAIDVAASPANLVLSGPVSGSAPLLKSGPGTLTLAGANTHSGGITVAAGTLAMGSPTCLGTGALTLSGGTLAMSSFAPANAIAVTADATISGGSSGGSHGVRAISGSGTLTLSATNVFDLEGSLAGFTGRLVFAGSGSFRFFGSTGSAAADFDLGTRSVTARSGTAFQFGTLAGAPGSVLGGAGGYTASVTHTIGAKGGDSTFAGTIQDGTGPVHVVKAGGGTLTLTGNCTHSGGTIVSAGRLRIDGSTSATTITVQAGATLGGSGSVAGNVILQSGAALEHGASTAPPLAVTGDLTLGSTLTLRPAPAWVPAPGSYTLLTYTGTLAGNPAITWEAPAGSLLEPVISTATPGAIVLTLLLPPRAPGPVTWTGADSSEWNLSGENWLHASGPATYLEGDTVSFLDAGEGTSISLPADVTPAAVIVDASKNYTFTGSGGITGTAALTKSGGGTLSLPGIHSYTGGTAVSGGTLAITQTGSGSGATGGQAGTGPITLTQGGTFRMGSGNGRNFPANGIVLPPGATGTLSSANLANGYGGSITGASDSTLVLSGPISFATSGSAQFANHTGGVILTTGSQLRFSSTSGPNGNGGAQTAFQIDGLLNTRNAGGANGVVLGSLSGSGTIQGQTNTPAGTTTYHVGARDEATVFAGTFADSTHGTVALRKTGAATLTLTGTSTHTGATTVVSGRLLVTGALGNTAVTIAPAGTLGGSGSIAGPVTVQGILAGGDLTCGGSLTLASSATLAWEIGASADPVQVAGDLVLDGSLHVTAAPGLAAGSYTLITHGGTLTDLGLEIASLPAGYTGTIDSSGGSVKLLLAPLLTPYESWQLANFGSTTSPDAAPSADPDADGTDNSTEFRLGLDPRDGASAFRGTGSLTATGFSLTWPTAPGLNFEIHRTSTPDGPWDTLATVSGTGTFTDTAPPPGPVFYRVKLLP